MKERDVYQRFLDGEIDSFEFRNETAKDWKKFIKNRAKGEPKKNEAKNETD